EHRRRVLEDGDDPAAEVGAGGGGSLNRESPAASPEPRAPAGFMFSVHDTIVAIATPPGRGGIGGVRLSGPGARGMPQPVIAHEAAMQPRHATFTSVRLQPDPAAGAVDHAVVTYFPAPHSYTGDDVVEVSAHGSPVVLTAIVAAAIATGARGAEPGEFTL